MPLICSGGRGLAERPRRSIVFWRLGRDGAVDYLISGKLPAGVDTPFAKTDLAPFTLDADFDYRIQGPGSQFELQRLRAWTIDRMVHTDRPLEEKMTLFWHGLFTSGLKEVKNVSWIVDQDALLHKEAMGNYKRLTHEIIHDPAMIKYLNNDQNVKGRPNENLARELMELFTMGEGNGYTEKDIPEVARALTGMTVARGFGRADFNERRHDGGSKTIFGKTGNYGPDDVVELIFDRPEPSTYLARRLWQFFGTPEPSDADVAAVSDSLRNANWDLAPALRTLFTSDSFYDAKVKFVVIKSPVELEAMTLRLLEEPSAQRMMIASAGSLRPLGEELFQPPNVKGWPGGEHWITSSAIFLRYNIAVAMANGMLGANLGGRFGGRGPNAANRPNFANAQAPATQPSGTAVALARRPGANNGAAGKSALLNDRQARVQAIRDAERTKVQEKLAAIPPVPPMEEMVSPQKLFTTIGSTPTADQLVDAAVDRFIQHPIPADKRAAIVQSLGTWPLRLGEAQSDRRVRQAMGLLLSTPEYQVE